MPAVQTSYSQTMRPAVAGMKADMLPETIVSRAVETAAGIGFGVPAFQGTGDRQIKVAAASAKFVGVTLMDQTVGAPIPPITADTYPQNDIAQVMVKGTVWVLTGTTVAAGDDATVTVATGAMGNTAVGTGVVLIGKWMTSAASGALAILRLDA